MKISLNINDEVKVKLTEYGLKILKDYWAETSAMLHRDCGPKADDQGYHTFQIHVIMNVFGPVTYNGNNQNCFEGNEIIVETSL